MNLVCEATVISAEVYDYEAGEIDGKKFAAGTAWSIWTTQPSDNRPQKLRCSEDVYKAVTAEGVALPAPARLAVSFRFSKLSATAIEFAAAARR